MNRTRKRATAKKGPPVTAAKSKQKAAGVSLRNVVLDEFDYAKDMFLIPLITVKEAIASGLRRNAIEMQKHYTRKAGDRGKTTTKPNP